MAIINITIIINNNNSHYDGRYLDGWLMSLNIEDCTVCWYETF